MRPSPFLTALALVGNFASGFSSPPNKPLALFTHPAQPIHLPTTPSSKSSLASIMSTNISRGGAVKATAASDDTPNNKAFRFVTSMWGTTGVVFILAKAVRRVLPIALEPFLETSTPLTQFQLM